MNEPDHGPVFRMASLYACLLLGFVSVGPAARAQAVATPSPPAAASSDSHEDLTVLGHRHRFETAPIPGPVMGPPPDKPAPHLGRYKISGDQEKKDGYDAQTGAYIGQFGTAYTGAGPVAGGLASRYGH